MREQDAKRPPAGAGQHPENERFEDLGSRQHRTREAARKDGRGAAEVLQPGAPPAPGIEEDYGARSGEVPTDEAGNHSPKDRDRPT